MYFRKFRTGLAAVAFVAAVPACSTNAHAGAVDTLGLVLGSYNVFVFGDIGSAQKPYQSDSEGAVAAGGNAYFQSFSVASAGSGTADNALTVGGSLSMTSGGSINGNTYVGQNADIQFVGPNGNLAIGGNLSMNGGNLAGSASVLGNVDLNGGASITGNLAYGGQLSAQPWSVSGTTSNGTAVAAAPFSFADYIQALTEASAYLASADALQQGTTGSYSKQYGGVTLTGLADDLNVFNLTTAELSALNDLQIQVPGGSTVIVNVSGSSLSMLNMGFSVSGTDRQHVLFNFVDATSLSIGGISFGGSILAPNAVIDGTWGNIEGSVVAAGLQGTTEFHNRLFGGDLPVPTVRDVPEPPAWTLMVVGGVGLALWRRRRGALPASAA